MIGGNFFDGIVRERIIFWHELWHFLPYHPSLQERFFIKKLI